ncbi:MAG TPA: SHOCT domain-containing protein [Solirubrobacteraceae bacterium]
MSNRVSRRQARRWGEQGQDPYDQPPQQYEPPPQQYAPPPAAPAAPAADPIEQLKQLADLHQQGVLTDEEFAVQKAKILGT